MLGLSCMHAGVYSYLHDRCGMCLTLAGNAMPLSSQHVLWANPVLLPAQMLLHLLSADGVPYWPCIQGEVCFQVPHAEERAALKMLLATGQAVWSSQQCRWTW